MDNISSSLLFRITKFSAWPIDSINFYFHLPQLLKDDVNFFFPVFWCLCFFFKIRKIKCGWAAENRVICIFCLNGCIQISLWNQKNMLLWCFAALLLRICISELWRCSYNAGGKKRTSVARTVEHEQIQEDLGKKEWRFQWLQEIQTDFLTSL